MMTFSLYQAVVPNYLQIVAASAALVDKAETFCAETGLAPDAIIDARLADDMNPFSYQVKSLKVHSIGAIDGVRARTFSPDMTEPPATFTALRQRLAETLETLNAVDPAEIDGFVGKDVTFRFGDRSMPFTAENFLLSFSQPNFYFHAATAYDLLRMKGLPIGKRDFMGRPRFNQS